MKGNRARPSRWPGPAALVLTVLALAAGCMPSLNSTEPPERVYWLETTALEDPARVRVELSVVPGLDSDRIWILEVDQRLNYFAGAFWADSLRPLLESLVSRSLGEPASGAPVVAVTVERFFAVESAAGGAPRVELRARISTASRGHTFQTSTMPDSERLRDIVRAHQQLLDELVREIDRLAKASG